MKNEPKKPNMEKRPPLMIPKGWHRRVKPYLLEKGHPFIYIKPKHVSKDDVAATVMSF